MGCIVWRLNPSRGETFYTCLDPAFYTMGPGSLSWGGGKWPGQGINCPPRSSSEVKGRVELYFYSLCVPSWRVIGEVLPFMSCYICVCTFKLVIVSLLTSNLGVRECGRWCWSWKSDMCILFASVQCVTVTARVFIFAVMSRSAVQSTPPLLHCFA
jgi:hypothetical protein